jgi:hypothetical protein
MNYKILLLSLITLSCSADDNRLNGFELEKNMQVILFEQGKEISRKNVNMDEQQFKNWITSLDSLKNEDFNSYAPSVILMGDKLKVNLLKGKTVISVKLDNDSKAVWQQYSRNPTDQDRKIRSLLTKL